MASTAFKNSLSIFLFTILFVVTGCGSSSELKHPTTSSTLWVQNAAEYKALTTSIYRTASTHLSMALEDSYWTAYPNQEEEALRNRPTAIILDVDETVLDNSPFQARMIEQGSSYNPQQWNQWVMEAKANPVPGAKAFTNEAADRGIAIFYLTNREAKVEEGTRENLEKLGFPLPKNGDHILSKNERENWTSAKTERRAYVADDYRIIMLFGDDLNDFVSAKGITQKQRDQIVTDHRDKWGRFWYVLPNPVYGSWESALYNFEENLTPAQIDSAKKSRLNTKQ